MDEKLQKAYEKIRPFVEAVFFSVEESVEECIKEFNILVDEVEAEEPASPYPPTAVQALSVCLNYLLDTEPTEEDHRLFCRAQSSLKATINYFLTTNVDEFNEERVNDLDFAARLGRNAVPLLIAQAIKDAITRIEGFDQEYAGFFTVSDSYFKRIKELSKKSHPLDDEAYSALVLSISPSFRPRSSSEIN